MASSMKFYETKEFMAKVAEVNDEAQVIKNPNTDKLFVDIGGKSYKCQQNIDMDKRMVFMHSADQSLDDACLVNAKDNSQNVIGKL